MTNYVVPARRRFGQSPRPALHLREIGYGQRLGGMTLLLALLPAFAWGGEAAAGSVPPAATEPATAQRTAANPPMVIVVSTQRSARGVSAVEIRRSKTEIVDAVTAAEIGALPDYSASDALQRVAGVQVARDRGEATGISIRGLTQTETLLNGREVFSAGNGRNLDYSDIPAEMAAGIDVYKTSAADQIEGGVGGTVDLRTHRPFDFAGRKLLASARVIHGDLVNKDAPQFSSLLSNRWQTGHGEVGALLDLAWQQRAWREDQQDAGAPAARKDIVSGQTVIVPNGMTETTSTGRRDRKAASLVLEWKPADGLNLYGEANYAEFFTRQNSYQVTAPAPKTFVAGSPVLFPGTNELQGITWTGASVTTVGAARDTLDRTAQFAAGGSWTGGRLTFKSDLSYTKSYNSLLYSAITLGGKGATLTQDFSANLPSSQIAGASLKNLSGFSSAGMWYAYRPFGGELKAATMDGEYRPDAGFFDTLSAGLRIANRHASDAPGQLTDFPAASAAANAAGLTIVDPYFGFLLGDPEAARNVIDARATLGITKALPTSNPLGAWDVSEDTQAGYFMGKFSSGRLDGNAGLRAVHTRETVAGNQGASAGPYVPVNLGSAYDDYLPSVNLRYELADGVYLRGALSKTLTRQDFLQLSPSLILNPVQLTGTAGNPALRPIRADNFDVALERYFDQSSAVYATAFRKRVDGFVATFIGPETYDGLTYQVSRPHNLNTADINGLEFGYRQVYDFLPGWLKGLGLRANYTWLASTSDSIIVGQTLPLQNLSNNSANVVGTYDYGRLSAHVAWNWRSKFLSGVANLAGLGMQPIYTRGYGWLDAALTCKLDRKLSLTLAGANLLGTERSSYYGAEMRPQSVWHNDRQISLTLTAQD